MIIDKILNLLIFSIFLIWLLYISRTILDYQEKEYLWNKILGMSEKQIYAEFKKKTLLAFLAFIGCIFVLNKSLYLNNRLFSLVNLIIMSNNFEILFFRSRYKYNIVGKLLKALVLGNCLYVFLLILISISNSGNAHEMAIKILNLKFLIKSAEVIRKPVWVIVVINIAIFLILVISFRKYDNRVCVQQRTFKINSNIKLEKSWIIMTIMYAGELFISINISHNKKIYSILSCIFILLVSGCADYKYHDDVLNRTWYRLLGETFAGFLKRKIIYLMKIQSPIIIIYIVTAIINNYSWITNIGVCLYSIVCGIGWNSYFAHYYTVMQRDYRHFEILIMYLAMLGISIPIFDIVLCIYWVVIGNRRWKTYVRSL